MPYLECMESTYLCQFGYTGYIYGFAMSVEKEELLATTSPAAATAAAAVVVVAGAPPPPPPPRHNHCDTWICLNCLSQSIACRWINR